MKLSSLAVIPSSLVLFAFWILLWGEWSIANVMSGVVAVPIVAWLFRHRQDPVYVLRPIAASKLVGFVLYSLVASSLRVARAVVAPTAARVSTSVQSVHLKHGSVFVASIVANAITLTPGTMTLELHRPTLSLDVHVLGEVDPSAFRDEILKLERLVADAFAPRESKGGAK